MAFCRHRIEQEQAGIFISRQALKSRGGDGDFLFLYQILMQARRAAHTDNVGDGVEDGIVGMIDSRLMVADEHKRLRGVLNSDTAFADLRGLDGLDGVGLRAAGDKDGVRCRADS